MKTKLLKRVRKNYRIVENGLGEQWIEIKSKLGDLCGVYVFTDILISRNTDDIHEQFRLLLHMEYSEYTRKAKIKTQKKKRKKSNLVQQIKLWNTNHYTQCA